MMVQYAQDSKEEQKKTHKNKDGLVVVFLLRQPLCALLWPACELLASTQGPLWWLLGPLATRPCGERRGGGGPHAEPRQQCAWGEVGAMAAYCCCLTDALPTASPAQRQHSLSPAT